MGVIPALVLREVGYVREDAANLRASLASVPGRVRGASPQRKTSVALLLGAASLVRGFSLVAEPLGWIILGACLLVTGFVLIDLDPPPSRRRRRAAAPRKKTT